MTDWETVVNQNVTTVQQTVYRLVGNHADAWDCIQEAFLEAVKIDRRETVRNWSALLRHLATVRALDLLRKRSRQRNRYHDAPDLLEIVSSEPDPHDHAEACELADRLRVAICRLPQRQAQAFCLTYFEQMTGEEMAEQLGIKPTASRMLLSRARGRLARLLKTTSDVTKEDGRKE